MVTALAIRKFKTAISQGRLDTLAAFFHGVVRQAHDVKVLHARGTHIHFDFDKVGVDSVHGGADGFKEHFLGLLGKTVFVQTWNGRERSRRGRNA
jgi:hypothetical protein